MHAKIYHETHEKQWPIIYRKEYNVNFCYMEKLHPFDARKWGHIFKLLKKNGLLTEKTVVVPNEAKEEDLLMVHSKKYLKSLNCSFVVGCIAEVTPLIFLPNFLVQRAVLKPMRYQTGGSILAGKIALTKGWAINIGGGFHHCSASKGGGFCLYADISLMVKFVFADFLTKVKKIMIVDLDAHQGNGYAHDFQHEPRVYILDVFNKWIYPKDDLAKKSIKKKVELDYFVEDEEYLRKVDKNLKDALKEFRPDLLIYNAGTDILKGDPLGGLAISEEGVIKRDELVFREARLRNIPIAMLTSGGYSKKSAGVIAASVTHLHEVGLIHKI